MTHNPLCFSAAACVRFLRGNMSRHESFLKSQVCTIYSKLRISFKRNCRTKSVAYKEQIKATFYLLTQYAICNIEII